MDVKVQLFHVAYQIKGNDACMNMIANSLPVTPPPPQPLGMGSKALGQNLTFSEQSHIVYQIKGKDKCSNMLSLIMFLHTPLTPGVGLIGQNILLKVVKLHNILKGMEHREPCKAHILFSHTHPTPEVGSIGQNIFSESSHGAYRISYPWDRLILKLYR